MGQGYAEYLREALDVNALVKEDYRLADWTVSLSPFDSRQHALRAAVRLRAGDAKGAFEDYGLAISRASDDPFLLQGYIRLKAEASRFDGDFSENLARVHELAPATYPLRLENAIIGVRYWEWGDARARTLWSEDVRFVAETRARPLLWAAVLSRRLDTLCGEPALRHRNLATSCRVTSALLSRCALASAASEPLCEKINPGGGAAQ